MRCVPEPLRAAGRVPPVSRPVQGARVLPQAGLIFMAYCPLARGRLFNDPVSPKSRSSKGKTLAQVALRWLVQQGNIAPIPRSANPRHMAESLHVFDFS